MTSLILIQTKTDKGVEVSFGFEFKKEIKEYWFAFCYPWSYEENKVNLTPQSANFYKKFLNRLESELKNNLNDIYFHKEILVHTKEKRNMHVITVSSNKWMKQEKEPRFNK